VVLVFQALNLVLIYLAKVEMGLFLELLQQLIQEMAVVMVALEPLTTEQTAS